ncbi:nuclear transport factor 2 family protein [Caulobacter soli]|uniref:nuclear transport factor 2 family protein n=1 Tax=Caulobacter soli TaxID=2708539 RepID=UPI0013EB489C|nr:nuclear transport factor 2 family protein [Caulobacter soli]
MDDAHALLTKVYDAYNRRDFAAFSALLTPDIDWPDLIEHGRLIGREAVGAYWARNDKSITIDVAVVSITVLPDGRVAADVNQIVRNLSGQVWSDSCVRHVFTLRDGLVARLDVEIPDERPRR